MIPPEDVEGSWISDVAATQRAQAATPVAAPPARAGYQTPLAIGAPPPGLAPSSYPTTGPALDESVQYPTAQPYSFDPTGYAPNGDPNAPIYDPAAVAGEGMDPNQGGPLSGPNGPGCEGPHPRLRRLWSLLGCGGGLYADTHGGQAYYARVEALSVWNKGNPVPALLTTSPAGTAQTAAGVLGQPGTVILLGDQKLDSGARGAGRLTVGYWLDDMKLRGFEGHYFALGGGGTDYTNDQSFTTNANAMILARPFFDVNPALASPRQDSLVLAYPNFNLLGTNVVLDGTFHLQTTSYVQSAGALYRRMLWMNYDAGYRLDLIGGYRFFRVDDSVSINDSTTTSGGLLSTTTFTASDQFAARNLFNGGEVGFDGQYYFGRVSLQGIAKSAFGAVHQQVIINGQSTVTTLGSTTTTPGGLLTQTTNIGTYSRSVFAALPEGQVNLRYDLTPNLRFSVGYTIMYLTSVQHSGSAIDNGVNPTYIGGTGTGPVRPVFAWDATGFFVQGISSGAELRW